MKIDELIEELEQVKEEHGNLEVSIKTADLENGEEEFSVATNVRKFTFTHGFDKYKNLIIEGPDYTY